MLEPFKTLPENVWLPTEGVWHDLSLQSIGIEIDADTLRSALAIAREENTGDL